jgi:hypothetical protein
MLKQTKTALAAAMVLDSSSQVEAIATRVGAIAPNALPADVASVLATDASTYLENAVVLSASATKQQMASIWQVIPGSGSTDNSIIMDNADAGFSMVGNWSSSTGVAGYYGGNYEFSDMGDGSSKATWQFDIATSGNYNVEARWTANSGRATDAPYTLYNNGTLVARVTKNQQINGGQFNPLGSYQLTAGTLEVVLDNKASGYVVADAVQVTSGGTTSGGTTGGGTTSGGTTLSGTPDPIQTGRLTLQWTAPVTRTDGTPLSLSDIDGYRIHYGKSSGNYTNHFTLADGTAQTVSLTGIPVGSYHLVMTTYDVDGRESGYSSEVIKIVQ